MELTFWSWAPGIEDVVALWNQQNPDVQVLVSRQDAGDAAVTKLLTAVRAGNGAPDLVQAEYQTITSLVAADAIADIAADLAPETPEHFSEGIWSAIGVGDGAVYAVPQDTGPLQLYYREDIFDDLGLAAPTTWDEYAEAARVVHEADPEDVPGHLLLHGSRALRGFGPAGRRFLVGDRGGPLEGGDRRRAHPPGR